MSDFVGRSQQGRQGLPTDTAVESCCALATRLGLETLPVRTDPPATHDHASLLEIVRCNRKSDCGSQRCSCKKTWNGLLGCTIVIQVEEIVARILPYLT